MEEIEKRDPGGPVAGMMTATVQPPATSAPAPSPAAPVAAPVAPPVQTVPPPPPEDALDPSFFDDNDNGHDIMNMDSVSFLSLLTSAIEEIFCLFVDFLTCSHFFSV